MENILKTWPEFSQIPHDPQWLSAMRKDGFAYLMEHGLPTPKHEGWKFTNLPPHVREFGDVQGKISLECVAPQGVSVARFEGPDSIEDWVRDVITRAIPANDANTDPSLRYLCDIFFRDGISIDIPVNAVVNDPVCLNVRCNDGAFYNIRAAIRVGANARAIVIEDHRGQGKFWKNGMTHIVLGPGSRLTHVRIQDDPHGAVYTQTASVIAAKDSVYETVSLSTGAGLSRNQVHVLLEEEGASCHINGANLMRGRQHADMTVLVEHLAPNCQSNQNVRTILDDQAHGVFQGKILVRRDAVRTDGYQLSKALILSEGAEMDTKPELEIYADDVKCSHGATTGRMDEDPLFYMQSRGISRDEAKALLMESFVSDVLRIAEGQPWFGLLDGRLREWVG